MGRERRKLLSTRASFERPEVEDATVERRKASPPIARRAGAFTRCPVVTRLSALRSLMGAKRNEGAPRASQFPGPMNHVGRAV